MSGEKLSAQSQFVNPFKIKLKAKIEDLGLSNDQLYNADESGLYWKLLPQKTYVTSLEKSAPGAKMEKQRITFLCCANASGSHKIKLLVIGKSKNSRSFKNFICPVNYRNSKSAWMTSSIFKEWFHNCFVPEVTDFLKKKGLPVKALLLIDNAPSHPTESDLKSEDGSIEAMFMPPNVTALIQLMDQNAIRITKLHYRNSLLATIIANEEDLLESMKKITLKEGVSILEASWNRVGKEALSNCWKNILNMVNDEDDPEFNVPLSVLKEKWQSEVRSLENTAADLLQTLCPQEVFTA
ncbi:jerky protein homolog-like, partial [Lucilia sericata]|uniref:jerky protein homolog-like n=1 Tax=Lucilia sericata TaxID=13632 RepID=UPI0018A7FA81